MSFGRAAVTRGVLLRLREQIDFTERGKELLKMKRDNLAAETNRLMAKVATRKEFDQRLIDAYGSLRTAYLSIGYLELQSQAFTVEPLEVRSRARSVVGVPVPELQLRKNPSISAITNQSAYTAASRLTGMIGELIGLAEAEAKIESIAQELMLTTRKVNALERVLIPKMLETLRYVESRLEEETLEEFFRAKRVKSVIRGKNK
jgi:V/A-type H+-transporting ATPase subunit D